MAGAQAPSPPESAALMRALAAHPEQMAALIEALHRRAVDAAALLDLMGRISRQAVRLLGGVGWAGVTAQIDWPPLTAAHTEHRVLVVDEGQYLVGDGPCLRAMRTGTIVAMNLTQVAKAWPSLAVTANRVGVRSFLAVPLRMAEVSVGALNLYSSNDFVPTPDPDLLTVLSEYASRGFTDFHTHQPPPTTGKALREALTRWSVVEQAVGVLMAVYGFTADYASDVLFDQAQDWQRTLAEQAAHIINTHPRSN